jgi:hypothetical protein
MTTDHGAAQPYTVYILDTHLQQLADNQVRPERYCGDDDAGFGVKEP